MPKPITIQIQLEPNEELTNEQIKLFIESAMLDACSILEAHGYVRCELYIGEDKFDRNA